MKQMVPTKTVMLAIIAISSKVLQDVVDRIISGSVSVEKGRIRHHVWAMDTNI